MEKPILKEDQSNQTNFLNMKKSYCYKRKKKKSVTEKSRFICAHVPYSANNLLDRAEFEQFPLF